MKIKIKKPNQDRSKNTVKAIKDALESLVLDGAPPLHLSTDMIANKAGVSIGSLYQFYQNKESIMADCLADIHEQQNKLLESATTKEDLAEALTYKYDFTKYLIAAAPHLGVDGFPSGVSKLRGNQAACGALSFAILCGKDRREAGGMVRAAMMDVV